MTIHHIINDFHARGGAEKIVRVLHQKLLKNGVESRVISLTGEVNEFEYSQSLRGQSVYSSKGIILLIQYLRKNCAAGDIIHAHLFPSNLFLSLAVRFSGGKGVVVCTEHSTNNRRRGTLLGWLIDKLLYSSYHHVVCISAGTKVALLRWMPHLQDRLTIIENGAELENSSYFKRSDCLTPIVVSIGRLHPLKNLDTALHAIALLNDLDFEYWIVGEGADVLRLKVLARELGIEEKVYFKGYIEDVFYLFRKSDIFLMPSKWEGFGLAAVEAMNACLPLVVSNVAGLRDVVTDKCAFTAPPNRPDLLANALRQLITNADLRNSMGKAAFQRSLDLSSDTMVERYIAFYNNILKHR